MLQLQWQKSPGQDLSEQPKRISARVVESDQSTKKQIKDSNLVGTTNEASIKKNNIETAALLDSQPGRERTLALLKERFNWPRMSTDVEKHVTKCTRCLRR